MNKLGWWIAFVLGCFLIFEYSNSNEGHSYSNAGPVAAASQPFVSHPSIGAPAQSAADTSPSPSAQSPVDHTAAHPSYARDSSYYTNSEGIRVHSPEYAPRPPADATARCEDGSYSFSLHRQGTCSHHGGVADWLQ